MTVYSDFQTALAAANTVIQEKAKALSLLNNPKEGNYKLYTDVIPTGNLYNQLVMVGGMPVIRQWAGDKQEKTPVIYSQTHEVVPYEATLSLSKRDLMDGSGVVNQIVNQFFAMQAAGLDKACFAAMIANPTGLDGVAMFSASHPYATSAGGTQGNYSTNALTLANFETARKAMMAFTNDQDELINAEATTMIVGPALKRKAIEMFGAQRVIATTNTGAEGTADIVDTTAIQNAYSGEITVVEDPRISGSTYQYYWFLVNSNAVAKPMALLVKDDLHVVALDKEDSPDRFSRNVYLWSVEAWLKVAPWNSLAAYGNYATS